MSIVEDKLLYRLAQINQIIEDFDVMADHLPEHLIILRAHLISQLTAGGGTTPVNDIRITSEVFTPTNGQTLFTVDFTPIAIISFDLNGVDLMPNTDYTVAGTDITYLNNTPLSTTDRVSVTYTYTYTIV